MFDTETTGIPPEDPTGKCKYAPYSQWGNQCRLLQLAWQVRGGDGECLACETHYVAPEEGLVIPEAAAAVHGITREVIQEHQGKPVASVLTEFFETFKRFPVEQMVAHNLPFDYHVILYELYRLKRPVPLVWKETPGYCTYRQGRRLAPRGVSGKLTGLYSHFVEPWDTCALKEQTRLHHADSDVEVCWRLFNALYPLTHPQASLAPLAPLASQAPPSSTAKINS